MTRRRKKVAAADAGKRGSKRALARLLGLAPSVVMEAFQLGRIPAAVVGKDRRVDFAAAVQALEASKDPAYEHVRDRWAKYRAERDGTAPPATAARTEGAAPGVAAGGEPVAAASPPASEAAPEAGRATNESPAGQPTAEVLKFQDYKAQKEMWAARDAELEFRKKAGELVTAKSVRKGAYDAALVLREALARIPDRLSQVLAAETDPARIHELISAEHEQALNEYCNGIDQRAAAAAGGDRGR